MAGQGVRMTRQPLNEALHYTAKQQMLLNIVRLKYNEPPEFLAVPSVTESLSYGRNTSASFNPFGLTGWGLGASASERPTISYSPLEDEKFNRRLVSPIPRDVIDLLGATGRSPGQLLRLTVKNINDVDNASCAGGPTPDFAPEFQEFKIAASILDNLHATRQVEITHVSSKDEKAGLDEKRGDESKIARQKAGVSDASSEDDTSGIPPAVRKLAIEFSEQSGRPQDFGTLIQNLTKSEAEQTIAAMSHADKFKMIGQFFHGELPGELEEEKKRT
jgi:hypothetical protein